MSIFTAEELAELAAADAEIDADFEETPEEIREAKTRERLLMTRDQLRKADRAKRYYAEHKAERNAYVKAYAKTHKAQMAAYRHNHYMRNRQKRIEQSRAYVKAHEEQAKQWRREYYIKNRDRILAYANARNKRIREAKGSPDRPTKISEAKPI